MWEQSAIEKVPQRWLSRWLLLSYFEIIGLEQTILVLVSGLSCFLAILLGISSWIEKGRYDAIAEVTINSSKLERKKIPSIFPHSYFDVSWVKGISESDVKELERVGVCSVSRLANERLTELSRRTNIPEERLQELMEAAKEFLGD